MWDATGGRTVPNTRRAQQSRTYPKTSAAKFICDGTAKYYLSRFKSTRWLTDSHFDSMLLTIVHEENFPPRNFLAINGERIHGFRV